MESESPSPPTTGSLIPSEVQMEDFDSLLNSLDLGFDDADRLVEAFSEVTPNNNVLVECSGVNDTN